MTRVTQCLSYKISGDFVGYDDRKNHSLLPENEVSGTGLGKVISTFSNEMERTFSWAMGCMRTFLHETDEAENVEFFVSGRGKEMVISAFST